MKRPGFRVYLFLVIGLLAALPIAVVGATEARRWESFQRSEADQHGLVLAEALGRELAQLIDSNVQTVEALARQVDVRGSFDPAILQGMVVAQHISVPGFRTLAIASAQGIGVAVDPPVTAQGKSAIGTNWSDREYFKEVMRTGKTVISDPILSRMNGNPIIAVVARIHDKDRRPDGISLGTFELDQVQRVVDRVNLGDRGGRILVLDRSGRVLAHPDAGARTSLLDLSRLSAMAPAPPGGTVRDGVDEDGVPVRTAAVTISSRGLGWTVVISRTQQSLTVQASRALRGTLVAAGVALLVSLVAAFPLAAWLTRPISRIARAVAAIGAGDLSHSLPTSSRWEPEELRVLTESSRSMLAQLRELLTALRGSKEEMIKTVGGLSYMMRAQTTLMERQTANMTELSTSARSIQEISAMAANRAEEVLVRAAHADELSMAGQQSVERSLRGLQEIRSQTENIVGTIKALLERTLEISEITDRVKDLADQSNVVAFNAAIQAMRAGELGRGFDVVAAEMRSLANRSITSTVRIREILGNAEKAIRSTASTSEEGTRKIQHGMEQIQESGSRLREMSVIVEVNSAGAREIASSVKQQYTGILEISRALQSLEEGMRETALVFEGAERVAEGLLAASERISAQVDAFRL